MNERKASSGTYRRSSVLRRGGAWITLLVLLASALGVWMFLAPLAAPGESASGTAAAPGGARSTEAPLVFLLLTGLCAVVVVAGLETGRLDSRHLAMLGVLTGINAVLRLVPGPPGFSAVFFLPIVTGYVLGAEFGFLLGALSIAVSAMLTHGMGPWVPFQMLAAGWTGLIPGWLPRWGRERRCEAVPLALGGVAAGFLFGLVINLWFWPVLDPAAAAGHGFETGEGLGRNLAAYGLYYLATSVWWDAGRALGNLVLLLAVGPPVLRLLRRFEQRFRFRLEPT
jgi:energy-coupling factor transport system substrate-specific component